MLCIRPDDTTPFTITTVYDHGQAEYVDLIFGDSDYVKKRLGLSTREIEDLYWFGELNLAIKTIKTYNFKLNGDIQEHKGTLLTINNMIIPVFGDKSEINVSFTDVNGYWAYSLELTDFIGRLQRGDMSVLKVTDLDEAAPVVQSSKASSCPHNDTVMNHALGKPFKYCRQCKQEI
jgi:hypothetical protein